MAPAKGWTPPKATRILFGNEDCGVESWFPGDLRRVYLVLYVSFSFLIWGSYFDNGIIMNPLVIKCGCPKQASKGGFSKKGIPGIPPKMSEMDHFSPF